MADNSVLVRRSLTGTLGLGLLAKPGCATIPFSAAAAAPAVRDSSSVSAFLAATDSGWD